MVFLVSPLRRRTLPALLLAAPALAQDWPSRPIRLIVPFTPGGPVDVVARLLAERLRDLLGQPVLIENRAGAGGSLGLRQVATSPPDGTAFVITSSSLAIWPAMHPHGGLDPRQDLTPVSLVADIATTIVARPGGPLVDLAALLRAARAEAGAITYGTSGIGSSNHLSGALFAAMAGVVLTHVPYRGASVAMNALLSRDIDIVFASTVETLPAHRDGRARILAVTTQGRIPSLPDVPAAHEAVPGYVAPNWFALAGPPGLPAAILSRLSAALAVIGQDASFQARLADLGAIPRLSPPEQLAARLAEDIPTWRRVAEAAGIRAE
ncbi:tripartite tricarboxylate transporter substrate-binding protein [Rhodovarius sp.]|jgi:tripartite-type tricarboxylate transporter receptor subunit TctC|uniref:Bug family tripartite tricarboxylate transporter substrate binding protein n=1 Tax=Rhodovarius sp. TaxID=2972673 RepID=UPI003342D239